MKWVFEVVSHRDDSSAYSTETSSNSETSLDSTDDTQQQQSDDQESDELPSRKRTRESDELDDALSASYDPNLLHHQIHLSLGNAGPKKRLCMDLEQADPLHGEPSFSDVMPHDDLMSKLLDLEHRVALARLLFPVEARIAMNISPVNMYDVTSATTSLRTTLDLNKPPSMIQEEHLMNRMRVLSRAVKLVKRLFPRCSEVLNRFLDTEDEYVAGFEELQDLLRKAVHEDKQELDRSNISSSSSS